MTVRLAPRLRRPAVALALSVAVFVPLATKAWQKEAFTWDWELSVAIHAYENRETFWNRTIDIFDLVLNPAFHALGLLVVAGLVVIALRSRRLGLALFVATAVIGATVLGIVLKEIVFARPPLDDPDAPGHSFPSGHAIRTLAVATVLTLVAWATRWRWPITIAASVVVALVGVALVYHEWHWVTDVLAGWCVSTAWIATLWIAFRGTPLVERGNRVVADDR